MVHMSYVPAPPGNPESTRTHHATHQLTWSIQLAPPPEIQRRGSHVGTTGVENSETGLRRRRDDEHGAEMVEFAIVVVLLIALLYGIITYGLILAAQATVTQAAADAARAGIVSSATAIATAEAQAGTDVGWMNKGTCGTSGTTITCVATTNAVPVERQQHSA